MEAVKKEIKGLISCLLPTKDAIGTGCCEDEVKWSTLCGAGLQQIKPVLAPNTLKVPVRVVVYLST